MYRGPHPPSMYVHTISDSDALSELCDGYVPICILYYIAHRQREYIARVHLDRRVYMYVSLYAVVYRFLRGIQSGRAFYGPRDEPLRLLQRRSVSPGTA